MSKARFKKGDKVRILDGSKIADYTCNWVDVMKMYVGKEATIASVCKHSITGKTYYCLKENIFHWDERSLKLIDKNETIVIYRDGQTVVALNKATKEKATAKCAPDDKFDFETGAKLAFKRLMPDKFKVGDRVIGNKSANKYYRITKEGYRGRVDEVLKDGSIVVDGCTVLADCFELDTSPEYFNGKVVCIESMSPFTTKGKIYKIKGGFGHFDDGTKFTFKPVTSVAELNKRTLSTFLEVVE